MAEVRANTARPADAGAGPIRFFDLETPKKILRADIEKRWQAILDHGAFIGGPEVGELESQLASWAGARHALAVASGTDALVIALMAENLGAKDAVFIPAFTYNATANAVIVAGATPVFVDVDEDTCNIDIGHLDAQIESVKREGRLVPRMIIAVDLFGLPADYAAINSLAKKHGMLVLADAAQSFGGAQNGRRIGALTDMTATSFYPSKTLGCYGDGGAMLTDDTARFERWSSIRWHGTDAQKKESIRVGVNGRLDSVQCAVLLAKLTLFPGEMAAREKIAQRYRSLIGNAVKTQFVPAGSQSAWGLFTVMVDDRTRVMQKMQEQGVPTSIYYYKALHQHRAFSAYAPPGGVPKCERLADKVMSLPMHPYLTDAQIERVVAALKSAIS